MRCVNCETKTQAMRRLRLGDLRAAAYETWEEPTSVNMARHYGMASQSKAIRCQYLSYMARHRDGEMNPQFNPHTAASACICLECVLPTIHDTNLHSYVSIAAVSSFMRPSLWIHVGNPRSLLHIRILSLASFCATSPITELPKTVPPKSCRPS
jgi:hypothetical protein